MTNDLRPKRQHTMRRPLLLIIGVLGLLFAANCGGASDSVASTDPVAAPVPAAESEAAAPADTEPEAGKTDADSTKVDAPAEPAEDDEEPEAEQEAAEPETDASAPTAAVADVASAIEPVVYDDDFATSIAPIFAEHCASCHNAGGPGAVHWQLDTVGDLADTHEWISQVVTTQYMPPWPSSDLSVPFFDDRSLRDDEIAAISSWSAAGAPLDVEATLAIAAPGGVVALAADIEIAAPQPYAGSRALKDDYRCMIFDPELTEPAAMQGFEFVPDQAAVVHHAIGYIAPARAMEQALELSARDDEAGWQCYGGSGLSGTGGIFLGWAPGQLPTQYPEGSGVVVEPGSFIVVQVHYHYDIEAPADASTIRIDWADSTDIDRIDIIEFLGPAEIPCAADETGPLCDRDAAIALARATYGDEGVLADQINALCGVRPEDFADMTNGLVSSTCDFPARSSGEIVSVFGHEHELGASFRMTLNPGEPDERVLLDIPAWSFDWQYNYYPSEPIMVAAGDTVRLDCSWDRSVREPSLEPAYVLWADGTNDEMCFATMALRADSSLVTAQGGISADNDCPFLSMLSSELVGSRNLIDATVDEIFSCADPDDIAMAGNEWIANNLGGLLPPESAECLTATLSTPDGVRDLLIFRLDDATDEERQPVADLVGECFKFSTVLSVLGFPFDESAAECIDEAGRPILVESTLRQEEPDQQQVFTAIAPCLSGG